MSPKWSPELRFLASCARTKVGAAATEYLTRTAESVDWPEVMRLAYFHRVQPIAYHSLKAICEDVIPQEFAAVLHRKYVSTAAGNLRLTLEMHEVRRRLEACGVEVIFFKGPVLAQDAYGNFALRPSGDIDLYIRDSDFEALEKCLRAAGYRPVKAVDKEGVVDYASLLIAGQCPFVNDESAWSLDVHTSVMPPGYSYNVSFDTLVRRSVPVHVGEGEVRGFGSEDLLQILCLHGAKNRWEVLKHVCDVAELLRSHPDIDWERVLETANAVQGKRILTVGLALARRILDAPVPADLWDLVERDGQVEGLVQVVEDYLTYSDRRMIEGRERLRFHLRIQDSFVGRARYGLYLLRRRLNDITS